MVKTQANKSLLYKTNQCYMVGMLSKDESYYPSGDEQKEITTMKNSMDTVIFYIRPLSVEPDPIVELEPRSDLYIGKDNDQNGWLLPYTYKLKSIEQKKLMIQDKLENKLIIFKPKMTFQYRDGAEIHYKNAVVVNVESGINYDKNTEFIPIPIIEMSNEEFEKKIVDGTNIILKDYSHQMMPPEHIMCNNYIYFNFPEWTKSSDNNGWICEKFDNRVKRIKINVENSELDGNIIEVSGANITFIEKQTLYKLEENGKIENLSEPIVDQIIPKGNIEIENQEEFDIKENNFINAFIKLTLNNNLCYSEKDLINLHVCVKTNPLTILAGMPGTGKSELASFYAKMLKATQDTLLFLPISPSFTEPGDILGFLNNTTGLYIPSETGLSEFLIHAKNNTNVMHVVIFDEMNLSQVEYWFSPFISLLERKEEDRILNLYNPSIHCINKRDYPPSIKIGDNVKFIGTVNVDETTKDFSDRLLDRANVINLRKEKFSKFKSEIENSNLKCIEFNECVCNSFDEYQSWTIQGKWTDAYTDAEIEFLDNLHTLINTVDEQKGVSFRIAKKIGEYLLNIPINSDGKKMITKREAFDLQIKQRLITKIKGTEKEYGELIGVIKDSKSTEPLNSKLYEFFSSEVALLISDFELTKKEIIKKANELGVYGYAN